MNISIFTYTDYRIFLAAAFDEHKQKSPFYSYRLFSQKAGFASPNFLKLVIDAKRNLTKESVFKCAKALGLGRKEADYFENLVFYCQSKTDEEKKSYWSRLVRFRESKSAKKIEVAEYNYYSFWYNPVIRELVTMCDFGDDYKKLGHAVLPAISALEAERSVALLCKLGFISKGEDTRYHLTDPTLTTGPQAPSPSIAAYHRTMLAKAAESIDRTPSHLRDITSVTVGISPNSMKAMTERVRQFRAEMLEIAENDANPTQMIQFNFQLFPVSETIALTEDRT